MDSQKIIDAIENGKLADASDYINDILLSRIGAALEERKTELGETLIKGVDVQEEEDSEYDRFFRAALKKFGVSSPADFDSEEEKKKFFNYVDKNFKAKNESVKSVVDPLTKKRVKTKPAKQKMGGPVTKGGKPFSPGKSKYRQKLGLESVDLDEASSLVTSSEEKELKQAIAMYRKMKDAKRREVGEDIADLLYDLKSGDMASAKVSFEVLDKNAKEMIPDSVYEKLTA